MKSYALKSAIELKAFKYKTLASSVEKLSFVDFRLTSRQDTGGWTNMSITSVIYDSSRSIGLLSRVKKGSVFGYGIKSGVVKLGKSTMFFFKSSVKKHEYKEYRLVSYIDTQRARAYGIKSSVAKNKMTNFMLKSFIHKKSLVNVSLKSSVMVLDADDERVIYFRSSFLSYVSPLESQRARFNGIRSVPANFKLLTVGTNGVKGVGIGVYGNIVHERNPIRSRVLGFKKDPTLTFYGVRHHICSIETSLLKNFGGVRVPGIRLIGVFGTLNGVRSNPIQFSVHRDIVDFDQEKSTAIKLSVFASDVDMSLKDTQIKIDFGSGLFEVKRSVFRRILSPYIEKVDDDTIFKLKGFEQKISVTSKATLFDTSKSKQLGLSTDIDDEKLPRKNTPSVMTGIAFKTMLTKIIALNPRSGVVGFVDISNLVVSGYEYATNRNSEIKSNIEEIEYQGTGGLVLYDGLEMIPEEIFGLEPSSIIVNSGRFKQTVEPGIEVEREVYITDEEGNVIEVKTIISRLITLSGARGGIHLTSAIARPRLNGIRCGISGKVVLSLPLSPISFRRRISLLFSVTHNYNGVRSRPSNVKITYTENRNGIRSNPQYLSANMMFTLPRVSANLLFEVN